jgi:hypothetical protein
MYASVTCACVTYTRRMNSTPYDEHVRKHGSIKTGNIMNAEKRGNSCVICNGMLIMLGRSSVAGYRIGDSVS